MPGPAARVGDMHVCPMLNPGSPPPPHVGGPVSGPGVPTVLIGGKPAAVMGDMCVCQGPPDTIVQGEATVLIGGKPAATMGSMTAHGGSITAGEPTVLIGTGGSGATAVQAVNKIPFPKINTALKKMASAAGLGSQLSAALANQEALKQAAEDNEGEPRIYGVQWVVKDQKVTEHEVFREVTVSAQVLHITDGESITFSIKRPTQTIDGQDKVNENEEDVITLTGTVKDKMVEVTWEIEKVAEEEETMATNENANTKETSQIAGTNQEAPSTVVSENSKKETEKKVVVFFIGGAGDKESFYGTSATNIIENEIRNKFDIKFTKNYNSYYLGYNEVRGADDLQKFVFNSIKDKAHTGIYIVGHSLGGWNGAHLSQILTDKGYAVDLLITLDPVGTGSWMSPIGIKVVADIYNFTPNPKANYWINISTDPKDYAADDFIADAGGQWLPDNNEKCNIFHKTKYSHGQAGKMFLEPLKSTNISASQMLEHFINEYLKK